MKQTIIVILCAFLFGCAVVNSSVVPENPAAVDAAYENVWNASLNVMAKHFTIYKAVRKDGVIESEYENEGSILEPWRFHAQNLYEAVEETINVVRRKAFLTITSEEEGNYSVQLVVIRQRQGYDFDPSYAGSYYDFYDPTITRLRSEGTIAPNQIWTTLGRDTKTENKLLEEINRKLQ